MNKSTLPKTPTLDKMQEIQDKSQLCGEFLEWLQSKFAIFHIKTSPEPLYIGSGDYINIEKTLAEFFDINLNTAEKERLELLTYLRNTNSKNTNEGD